MRGNGVKMISDTTCVYSGVQGGRAKAGVTILLSERFVPDSIWLLRIQNQNQSCVW